MHLLPENHHLDIYGDGPLMATIQKQIQEFSLQKKIQVHGFIPQEQLNLSQYDIALASRYLAILEALAYQLPVIAQYNSTIKEDYLRLAPFAPWIHIVKSPAEIAAAVQSPKLIEEPATQWITEQSWGKLTNQYLQLWQK
jgi:glycosyltransferase involved in cell wall biosynthesis